MKNHEVVTRKEYIEREAAIVAIKNLYPGIPLAKIRLQKWHEENKNFTECELAIERVPAADVAPVRHGRWKPRDLTWGRSYYYCTLCKETVDMPTAMGIPMFKFCPNCGARMDGDET